MKLSFNIVVNEWEEFIKEINIPNKLGLGVAVAYIRESKLHYHEKTVEIYYVIKGEGIVVLDNKEIKIREGEFILIKPGVAHKVISTTENPIEILCISIPPFNPDDFHPVEK